MVLNLIHEMGLVFGRNITLRYDTGSIREFYAHVLFNPTPPILHPQFYGPPKSQTRSMNYPEMPCEWSIAGEYRGLLESVVIENNTFEDKS